MRRLLLALAALLLSAAPASAQSPQRAAHITQVDTSGYPDVTLYISVTDSAGRPVAGLTQQDFTITEDGQPVTISSFGGSGSGPIHTVLLIDRSGSMEEAGK